MVLVIIVWFQNIRPQEYTLIKMKAVKPYPKKLRSVYLTTFNALYM